MSDKKVVLASSSFGIAIYKTKEFGFYSLYDPASYVRGRKTEYTKESQLVLAAILEASRRRVQFIGLDEEGIEKIVKEVYKEQLLGWIPEDIYIRYCKYPISVNSYQNPDVFKTKDVFFLTEAALKNFGIKKKS